MTRRLLLGSIALLALFAAVFAILSPARISSDAIERSVIRSPALLEKAWSQPVASTYGHQIDPQTNASLCGPASLANVFRSLGEATATESRVLAGTGRCWTGYCILGLTLDELAQVAQAHTHKRISVLRDLTADAFREHLRRSNDPGRRYIVNFRRDLIFGAGFGHHSPLAGYLEAEDLVFVLDVNRSFGPWLVNSSRLFAAMDSFDGDNKRGLLLVE
jgi:hypothetical protein